MFTDALAPLDPAVTEPHQPVWESASCFECGGSFTVEEWEVRHTPAADPLADVHDHCCQDCPR